MTKQRQVFEEQMRKLIEKFIQSERPGESDESLAEAVLEFILQIRRLQHGLPKSKPNSAIDNATISKMKSWDSNDPTMAVLEKVLRRFAQGRGADAIGLLKAAVTAKVNEISRLQRERAKLPRKRHSSLDATIADIVRHTPKISARVLEVRLRDTTDDSEIIDHIDDTEVHLYSGKSLKLTGLADRLSRIKGKIAKAG